MKKLTFEQSKHLVQLMTVLLQLDVITLHSFAHISMSVANMTALNKDDHLMQMVLDVFDATKDQ